MPTKRIYQDDKENLSLEEQVSELQYLRKRDAGQLKAAVMAVQRELKTSNMNLETKFNEDVELLQGITLELHNFCRRIESQSSSGDTQNNSKSVYDVENVKGTESVFSDALGPVPDQTEVRLMQIEKLLEPIKDDLYYANQVVSSGDEERPETARFLNICNSVDEEGELVHDIYALFMISSFCSLPSLYAMIVFSCQCFIVVLILIDLLQDEQRPIGVHDDNPLNVPAKVEWTVACAQVVAIIIAYITVNDMITGLSTIFVCCLIVVQSNEVLEIFMNFAAVAFISELDNMAFELAEDGLCGKEIQMACERVKATKVKVMRENLGWLTNVLYVSFFLLFSGFYCWIRAAQYSGKFLALTACNNVKVRFGDEIYRFPTDVRFSFEGDDINKTLAKSKRSLPFLEEKPHPLAYQFFSGTYMAERAEGNSMVLEEFNARPVYWERGFKDPLSGKFYYCDAIKSWVFTIEALYDTPGAIPEEARRECSWGWLMQSPVTEAITLEEAPTTNWNIWTGNMETSTSRFSIVCSDCERNSDCGLTHGSCDREHGVCICTEEWQGDTCQMRNPYCPALLFVYDGHYAPEYVEHGPFTLNVDDEAVDPSSSPITLYERPTYIFYSPYLTQGMLFLVMYTGARWFTTQWYWEDVMIVDTVIGQNHFHAYWDTDRTTRWYSDPTSEYTPIGLQWNERRQSNSRATDIFGASFKTNGRFECLDVDCVDIPEICGDYGVCVSGVEEFEFTANQNETQAVTLPRNQCECRDGFGGYFCEYSPTGPYSGQMYSEYMADPVSYRKNNSNLSYLKFWVNQSIDEAKDEEEEEL